MKFSFLNYIMINRVFFIIYFLNFNISLVNCLFENDIQDFMLLRNCAKRSELKFEEDKFKEQFQNKLNEKIADWILNQIEEDYRNNINLVISQENIADTLNKAHGYVRYKIINNKLICVTQLQPASLYYPRWQDFNTVLNFLLEVAQLPDLDFIVSLGDSPYDGHIDMIEHKVPIFAFCKRKHHKNVILIPDIQSLTLALMGKITEIISYNQRFDFNVKIKKAFWRGATSGGHYTIYNYFDFPRTKLVKLSSNFYNLLDAKFHSVAQADDLQLIKELTDLNYIGNEVSFEEHVSYKYQILMDGNTCSWGGSWWRFLSNSLVMKQESDWLLWFYPALKPYEHYVPFKHDCSDLIEKINWCIGNDDKMQDIIKNANEFAYNNLTYVDMLFYIYNALIVYSKIQNK